MPLQRGTRLGPYEVRSLIGTGGMGDVYRARDTRLDRPVALKVLAPQLVNDPEFRARFTREARAISALNHAHICGLYDIGREQDIDYLVLELLEGETLAARLAPGPLPLTQGVEGGQLGPVAAPWQRPIRYSRDRCLHGGIGVALGASHPLHRRTDG